MRPHVLNIHKASALCYTAIQKFSSIDFAELQLFNSMQVVKHDLCPQGDTSSDAEFSLHCKQTAD